VLVMAPELRQRLFGFFTMRLHAMHGFIAQREGMPRRVAGCRRSIDDVDLQGVERAALLRSEHPKACV